MIELPRIRWRGRSWIVDFRLEEVRSTNPPFDVVKFTELTDERFKAELRGIRARTSGQYYIEGLDN